MNHWFLLACDLCYLDIVPWALHLNQDSSTVQSVVHSECFTPSLYTHDAYGLTGICKQSRRYPNYVCHDNAICYQELIRAAAIEPIHTLFATYIPHLYNSEVCIAFMIMIIIQSQPLLSVGLRIWPFSFLVSNILKVWKNMQVTLAIWC